MKQSRSRNWLILIATSILTLLMALSASAQNAAIGVTTLADELNNDGDCSLREAVQTANTGVKADACAVPSSPIIIFVPAGTVTLTMGDLDVSADITFSGAGDNKTTLNGNGNSRIFNFASSSTSTIQGIVLRNGAATSTDAKDGGGAILTAGNLTIANSTIADSVTTGPGASGGGIMNNGGTLTISNSTITGNHSVRAGGGIETAAGTVTLTNVNFSNNVTTSMPGNGGALHVSGPGNVTATHGVVTNNSASAEGGGFWNASGIMTINGTIFEGNIANGTDGSQGGGALFNIGGTLNVTNATIRNNKAMGASNSSGGGLLVDGGTVTVRGTIFQGNSATRAGGAIELDARNNPARLTVENSNFLTNSTGASPGNGGAIHVSGPGNSDIRGGIVRANIASAEGGGFWNASGTMNINNVTFDGNIARGTDASQGGGALFNIGGTLNVANAIIRNNEAQGDKNASGGGLLVDGGTVSIQNTTFESNKATRAGGAIELDARNNPAELTVASTNFLNNSTGAAPGNGGAIHVSGGGNSEITGGVVRGNMASAEGGGFWNASGMMTINGTAFENNVASGTDTAQGGGALFNIGGTMTVNNVTLRNNKADGDTNSSGGGILVDGGTLTVRNSSFVSNSATRAGGGIELDARNTPATMTVTDSYFTNNNTGPAPGNGGAIHISGAGDADITNGTVTGNMAAREGGGLWNGSGTMTVNGTLLANNTAAGAGADDGGGALFNNGGTLNVMNATVTENKAIGAKGSGGGILNLNGMLNVSDTTISNNTSNRAGGGIEDNAGSGATITNVRLTGNDAGQAPGNGGGLHISGPGSVTVNSSTVVGNVAVEGGGLWNSAAGTLTVRDSAVFSNRATGETDGDNGGGGIFNDGMLSVMNSTISANQASAHGGGIFNTETGNSAVVDTILFDNKQSGIENLADMPIMLTDSVVAHNGMGGADCIGPVTSSSVLDSDRSCGGTDVRLGDCDQPALGPWPPCVFNQLRDSLNLSFLP